MTKKRIEKLPCQAGASEIAPLVHPVFIADLHLSWRKLTGLKYFFRFLKTDALRYKELFILGDLVEYWIGDDASWIASPISRTLKKYAEKGHSVYLMQGNRDALFGEMFAKRCGATLLAPEITVECRGKKILLSHGDVWCTLDKDYQRFRRKIRSAKLQTDAFSMGIFERIKLAQKARMESIHQKHIKTEAEMDVVEADVLKSAKEAKAAYVIHGHTHRAAEHPMKSVTRFVLPDWELDFTHTPHYGWIDINAEGKPEITLGF